MGKKQKKKNKFEINLPIFFLVAIINGSGASILASFSTLTLFLISSNANKMSYFHSGVSSTVAMPVLAEQHHQRSLPFSQSSACVPADLTDMRILWPL